MRLNPPQWPAHLRGALAPVYVVGGDEPLLVMEAVDLLREAAKAQGVTERQVLEVDRSFDWSQLAQASASLSLFASKRLIEVSMPGSAPGDDGSKALRALAAQPPSDTIVAVLCGKIEWKARQSAWFGALEQAGASLYFEAVPPARLPDWIRERLAIAKISADDDAIALLAERTEGNLLAAKQDIDKLALLYPGARLNREAVRSAVSDSARYEAFDLIEKVLLGDARGVARSLPRLREEGVDLYEFLGAWTWTLRTWVDAAGHYARTRDARRACESARLFGPRQAPYLKALPRTTPAQVQGWLARCADIDLKGKSTGGEPAAWADLLTCLLAASGLRKAAPDRTARPIRPT